jgi:L-fuculose-phosphate aldolase
MAEKTESQIRADIIEVCKRIHSNGWVASNDGNVSVKISEERVLCTPTGMSKGYLTSDQLIKVDMEGNKIDGELNPSSEMKMHLDVFKHRQDVRSVVHAHPPYSTGFAVAGVALDECVIPEIIVSLGSIPLVEYGTPSTFEIPDNVRKYLKEHSVFLLESHGALSVGSDAFQAYYRMESLELFAKISLIAKQIGNVNQIREEEVRKILDVRKDFGLSTENYPGCKVGDKFLRYDEGQGKQDSGNYLENNYNSLDDKITLTRKQLIDMISTVVKGVLKSDKI